MQGNGVKWVRLGDSVPETGFYGTEEIFGAKNSLLWYATHLQRPAEQPTAAPDASSVNETAPARG